MQELNQTAHKLLDMAEHFTQSRGFNAFSYKDLQNEVGVKTSSIHYYFPTKQDLAVNMTERYVERFSHLLGDLALQNDNGLKRIEALTGLFVSTLHRNKFCLCGMLTSDLMGLPEAVNNKLCEFFDLNELWLAQAVELAKSQGQLKASTDPERAAAHILATLEGGMLIARARKKPEYLEAVVSEALANLKS